MRSLNMKAVGVLQGISHELLVCVNIDFSIIYEDRITMM